MKVKEKSAKAGLKLNIQKTKIMVSGPTTSWQIDGKTLETERDFILVGSIQKQRHCFAKKVHLVKAMVFPVVMYGCESWTVKKAKRRKLMLLNCGVGEDS